MTGSTLRLAAAPLVATLVLAGCPRRAEEPDPLLATFAGGEVRQSDLDTWRSFLNAKGRDGEWLGLDAVERHVVMRTLARQAIEAGLEEEPATRIRLKRALDERLAVLLHDEIVKSVEVPEALVDRYLEEHRSELDKPERRTVSFIFRRASGEGRDRARAELEAARERLLAGEDFAKVAVEVSESPSRLRGGLLGTVPAGKLPEQIDRVLFALDEGEVSDVIATGAGLALLRCDRVLPAHTMESEEARRRVERYFRRPGVEAAWDDLVTRLTEGRIHHDLEVLLDPAAGPEAVVSTFGSEKLTRAEARILLRPLGEAAVEEGAPEERAEALLDRFAVNALLAAEARRRHLDEQPERRKELEWVRIEQLSKEGLRWRVDPMLAEPGDEDLHHYYEDHADSYREPNRYLLRVLQRPHAADTLGEAYRELARLADGSRDGVPILAPDGGAVAPAWHTRSEIAGWGLTVLRSVDQLEPGEVTEPIQEEGALWLIQLVERERGRLQDFSEVRSAVKRALQRQERRRINHQVLQWTLAAAGLHRSPQEPRTQKRGKD